MNPRGSVLAIAATAVAFTGCISGMPMSLQGVAPAGPGQALSCATQQLNQLGYTIDAGDSKVGFVRGEKHLSKEERWFLPGKNERDVLTAAVFDDPTTGAASLRVTAALRSHDDAGAPTKRGTADANTIVANCADEAALESQGGVSG